MLSRAFLLAELNLLQERTEAQSSIVFASRISREQNNRAKKSLTFSFIFILEYIKHSFKD
jgi:hypothetical protein